MLQECLSHLVSLLFYFNQYCRIVVITLFLTEKVKYIEYIFQWLVVQHPCL